MDYREEEQFLRMQQSDTRKCLFMSCRCRICISQRMEYEKDMDRMKSCIKGCFPYYMDVIEDECDKMEYEGSLLFDEYPDRLMLGG